MTSQEAALLLSKDPRVLKDDDLRKLVPLVKSEADHRHRECSKYLGIPCQEGKRKYEAYKQARALLERLKDECKRRM